MGKLFIYVHYPHTTEEERDHLIKVCSEITKSGKIPLAPSLYCPLFLDEATQRQAYNDICEEFAALCDQVWTSGEGELPKVVLRYNMQCKIIEECLDDV